MLKSNHSLFTTYTTVDCFIRFDVYQQLTNYLDFNLIFISNTQMRDTFMRWKKQYNEIKTLNYAYIVVQSIFRFLTCNSKFRKALNSAPESDQVLMRSNN